VPLHGRPPAEAIGAAEAAGVSAVSLTSRAPTLDDVYLRLTGGQLRAAA
jgi:hypothetical protein